MPTRSFINPISIPTSRSVLISGLRLWLPRLSGCRPGPSSDDSDEKVVNLSKVPGCNPDWPTAARRRSVDTCCMKPERGQPRNAVGRKDTPAFGYRTPRDVRPNALLRSYRAPTVTNANSLKPICSCAKPPAFTVSRIRSYMPLFWPALVTSSPGPGKISPPMPSSSRNLKPAGSNPHAVDVVAEWREVGADLVHHVHTERHFHIERRHGLIAHVDAAGEMLDVLAVRLLHRLAQGVECGRAVGIPGSKRGVRHAADSAVAVSSDVRVRDAGGGFRLTKNRRRNGAENVVVVRRGFVTPIHVLRIDSDSYVARRHHHDRCRALHFSVQVACRTQLAVATRSILALTASVDEVRHRCRPTAHRARVRAVVAGLEEGGDEPALEHLIRLDWHAVELGEIVGELRRLPAAVALGRSGFGEPRDAVP